MSLQNILKYKTVLLGEISVGKTSLISRLMYDKFDDSYQATIGIDHFIKTMYLGDTTIKLQLWDTAGQERFRSLIPTFIRNSRVAIVVYDITNRSSFTKVNSWVRDVRNECGEDIKVVIIGNKVDMDSSRKVWPEEGEELATKLNAIFMETSAKTGSNVQAMFKKIVMDLYEQKVPVKETSTHLNINYVTTSVGSSCAC
ncbi:Ras- protein Rab-6B [Boothiomyces macroporosus]|uniref:Ras- protein Rab-6B n=1 Tax=Boothiomyces macroporosus TaxID=261099 RepID=A0AAD5UD28_9FUNG|nr:Ras- protein Rab-6B [Boothiomyces macroporosus]